MLCPQDMLKLTMWPSQPEYPLSVALGVKRLVNHGLDEKYIRIH